MESVNILVKTVSMTVTVELKKDSGWALTRNVLLKCRVENWLK